MDTCYWQAFSREFSEDNGDLIICQNIPDPMFYTVIELLSNYILNSI